MRPLFATAALGLALAVGGCGVGFGPGSGDGEVDLSVTRDYGRTQVAGPVEVGLRDSDTVMRILDRSADVETSYGGRFVEAIDGIENASGSRSFDWFYFVDGIAADIGAAEFEPESGASVWWDYRDWTAAMEVGAVTGSYPAPLAGTPVGFTCSASAAVCDLARERLADDGIELVAAEGDGEDARVRVEVGPIDEIDSLAADEEPASSGVFAGFSRATDGGFLLRALDQNGVSSEAFGSGAGLVAAVKAPGGEPTWVITGTDDRGVEAATSALDSGTLASTYAVVVPPDGSGVIPVPTSDQGGGEA